MKATTLLTVLLIALTIYIVNADNTTEPITPTSHVIVNGYDIYTTHLENGDYIIEILKDTETLNEFVVLEESINSELELVIDFCKSH